MNSEQRTVTRLQIFLTSTATLIAGIAIGLYIAAAFIGPAIIEAGK